MTHELLMYLSKRVQDEIDVLSGDLARGTAKDHGEYKYYCGIIRGLMITNGFIAEAAQRMEQDDD
jgi:hypothetical protein